MTESPVYAGIASFFKAPHVAVPSTDDGDVAVLGVPYDEGATARSGTRMGPRALREISTIWAYRSGTEPFFDGEAGTELLGGLRWVDTGDVELPPTGSPEVIQPLIAGRLAQIAAAGLFPMTLGGDHSITYPLLRGLAQARDGEPVHLVQFDTHMDYWNDESGMRFTHASPIIRSHEDGLISDVTQFGIRGLHTASDNISLAGERGVHTFWCEQAKLTPVADLVAHLEPGRDAYITFDIDCLDPAIAPGTGTPEPGGFTYYEAKALLRAVAQRVHVVGLDMVEVNPLYDPAQVTAMHAVRLILDTVGAALGG
jgi:agmatinase